MKFAECPLCGEPTNVGSHWDCVFELIAEWVEHRPPKENVLHIEGVTEKDEEKNG